MSTHNIDFYGEISKIIPYHQISPNTHDKVVIKMIPPYLFFCQTIIFDHYLIFAGHMNVLTVIDLLNALNDFL